MKPLTIARLATIAAILWVYALASQAGTLKCTRGAMPAGWKEYRVQVSFERCRDTRGGAARRACEARHAELINTLYATRRQSK